jgi:hypothetical protein
MVKGKWVHTCDCSSTASHGPAPSYYAGLHCEYPATDYCKKKDGIKKPAFCVNHGVCQADPLEGCVCPKGFYGSSCEFKHERKPRRALDASVLNVVYMKLDQQSEHSTGEQSMETPQRQTDFKTEKTTVQLKNGVVKEFINVHLKRIDAAGEKNNLQVQQNTATISRTKTSPSATSTGNPDSTLQIEKTDDHEKSRSFIVVRVIVAVLIGGLCVLVIILWIHHARRQRLNDVHSNSSIWEDGYRDRPDVRINIAPHHQSNIDDDDDDHRTPTVKTGLKFSQQNEAASTDSMEYRYTDEFNEPQIHRGPSRDNDVGMQYVDIF